MKHVCKTIQNIQKFRFTGCREEFSSRNLLLFKYGSLFHNSGSVFCLVKSAKHKQQVKLYAKIFF